MVRRLLTYILLLCVIPAVAQPKICEGLGLLLEDKMFNSSDASVLVYDLTADTMLFEHRSHKLVRPASVMKVLTSVVALDHLGAGYGIKTTMYENRTDSTLNVYVKGEMDPLFGEKDIKEMATSVPQGSVIDTLYADCSMIDSLYWGPGWSWDDNPYGYQPYISPLMLCGGAVEVVVKPTDTGQAPEVVTTPVSSFYTVVNEAECGNKELGNLTILRDWLEDSNVIRIRGNCTREKKEKMNMYRSADFFMAVLAEKFDSLGVVVKNIAFATTPDSCDTLYTRSRSVEAVVRRALLDSDNICAESLLYHLGKTIAKGTVSMSDGCTVVSRFVKKKLGVTTDFAVADGSGLSLYNYVTADLLFRALRYAHHRSRVGRVLYSAMPQSGMTGTLKNRTRGTAAYGKVRAKTGTVKAVSSLAGYLNAANGHRYAFVLLNTGMQSSRPVREWQDKVCDFLCK